MGGLPVARVNLLLGRASVQTLGHAVLSAPIPYPPPAAPAMLPAPVRTMTPQPMATAASRYPTPMLTSSSLYPPPSGMYPVSTPTPAAAAHHPTPPGRFPVPGLTAAPLHATPPVLYPIAHKRYSVGDQLYQNPPDNRGSFHIFGVPDLKKKPNTEQPATWASRPVTHPSLPSKCPSLACPHKHPVPWLSVNSRAQHRQPLAIHPPAILIQ